MPRGRGICCSRCTCKIDRYDETLKCSQCNEHFHIKGVNVLMDDFNDLRDKNLINEWLSAESGEVGFEQATKSISGLHKNSGSLKWSVVASKRNIKEVSHRDGDSTTSGNFSDNMLDGRNKVEKRLKPIVGSSQSNVLKSAARVQLAQIHISRLHSDTDISDVRSFLNQITSDVECDKLSSRMPDV
ncbi:hypothetical protein WA026_019468 [Henosepilachna vigintioctopunctata]|uniref:Uncharacterized protein n=1 Tax=Henosepilachna vigintioctopunctata TaxID=420089 RepID=A0AAW1UB10_9CUCU